MPAKIEEGCSKEAKATSGRPEEESREVTNTENTGECRPRRERSLKMKIPGKPETRKRRHIRVEMNEVCACIAQVFVQPITFVPQFPKVHNISHLKEVFYPLTLESDKQIISPHITPQSHIKIMRVKKMITD